jgi:hypothetical protein
MRYAWLILAAVSIGLAACAATTQDIAIQTVPPGAGCTVSRDGANLGQISTPGSIKIAKGNGELTLTCEKSGYEIAIAHQSPESPPTITLKLEPAAPPAVPVSPVEVSPLPQR